MEPYQMILVGGTGLLHGVETFLLHQLRPEEVHLPANILYIDGSGHPERERLEALKRWAARADVPVEQLEPFAGDGHASLSGYWVSKAADPIVLRAALTAEECQLDIQKGFYADPKLAATATVVTRAIHRIMDRIRERRGTCTHRVLAGSVGGGTGAGGLPLLARRLRRAEGSSHVPHYDGVHLHVIAYLPWFNPDDTAPAGAPPGVGPGWERTLRNANGGVRSLLEFVRQVAEQEARAAVLAQAAHTELLPSVETNVFVVGPAPEKARGRRPLVTPERVDGWGEVHSLDPLLRQVAIAQAWLLHRRDEHWVRRGSRFGTLFTPPVGGARETSDAAVHARRQLGEAIGALARWPLPELASTWGVTRVDDLPELIRDMITAVFALRWERRPREFVELVQRRWHERAEMLAREGARASFASRNSVQLQDFDALTAALRADASPSRTSRALRRDVLGVLASEPGTPEERVDRAHRVADLVEEHLRRVYALDTLAPEAAFPGEGPADRAGRPTRRHPDERWSAILPEVDPALRADGLASGDLCKITVDEHGKATFGDRGGADALLACFPVGEGLHSQPFASPLGLVHALDALLRGKGARALECPEGRDVIALWRAALRGLLEFAPAAGHDNRVIEEGDFARIAPDCHVVRFQGVAVGFTAVNVGFVPHVERIDRESSQQARSESVRRAWEALVAALAGDDADDRSALEEFLRGLYPDGIPTEKPLWVALLDGWAGRSNRPSGRVALPARSMLLESGGVELRAVEILRFEADGDRPRFTAQDGGTWGWAQVRDHVPAHTTLEILIGGARAPMPFLPGVCVARREGKDRLYVWTEQPHVAWDAAGGILSLYGEIVVDQRRHELTFRVRFPKDFRPIVLRKEHVFAQHVIALAGFKGDAPAWVYAEIPVREEYLHLVQSCEPIPTGSDERAWSVAFLGGVSREWRRSVDDAAAFKVGIFGEAPVPIAIWPGSDAVLPEAWRFYTVLCGDDGTRMLEGHEVHCFGASAPDARGLRDLHRLDEADRRAVRAFTTETRPRFLHVVKRDAQGNVAAEGAFLVPAWGVASAVQPVHLGVDFGTTNTCVAIAANEALGHAGHPSHRPAVLVRNTGGDLGLVTNSTWIPSVPVSTRKIQAASLEPDFVQIPSGLYRRGSASALPFADYTFISPRTSVEHTPDRWVTDLKWSAAAGDDDARRARADVERRDFLVSVLLWTVARLGGAAVDVRASFPLAFASPQRSAYGALLDAVIADVRAYTGAMVGRAPVPGGAPDANAAAEPFADESTVLVDGAGDAFLLDRGSEPRLRLVVAVDIGGHTVDIVIGALTHAPAAPQVIYTRTLAADSIAFGANVLEAVLLDHTHATHDGTPRADLLPLLNRYRLERVIRTRALSRALHASDEEAPNKAGFQVAGLGVRPGGKARIKMTVDSYFAFIRQCVARMIAGVVTDRESAVFRLLMAPGTGGHGTFAREIDLLQSKGRIDVSIVPMVSGNGWQWLRSSSNDRLEIDKWLAVLEEEVGALLSLPTIGDGLAPAARASLRTVDERARDARTSPSSVVVSWKHGVVQSKDFVARRLAILPVDGRNSPAVRAEASPNGFDVRVARSWTRMVGEGSLAAQVERRHGGFVHPDQLCANHCATQHITFERKDLAPLFGGAWEAADPVDLVPLQPPFPGTPVFDPAGEAGDMPAIVARQMSFTADRCRVVSTMRAWLEVVVARRFNSGWTP